MSPNDVIVTNKLIRYKFVVSIQNTGLFLCMHKKDKHPIFTMQLKTYAAEFTKIN